MRLLFSRVLTHHDCCISTIDFERICVLTDIKEHSLKPLVAAIHLLFTTKHSKSVLEEKMAEEAKRIRTSAKARFTRKRNEFLKSIKDNKGIDTVKRTFAEFNEAWNTVEGKHDIYTIHLTEEEVKQSESWITELQE